MMRDGPSLPAVLFFLLVVLPSSAGLFHLTARYVLVYRIHSDRIQFLLFGIIPVGHIKFLDIAAIRVVPWTALFSTNPSTYLALHNRLFGAWVMISKKRGFPSNILITPGDTDELIEAVGPVDDPTSCQLQ